MQRALAKLHFQYISPLVCGSKAARKMWLGHFTLGNGAYRAQEEESLWLSSNPREFSENSKLVLFQTKFVEEEEVEPGMLGLRKCESLESAFSEM